MKLFPKRWPFTVDLAKTAAVELSELEGKSLDDAVVWGEDM